MHETYTMERRATERRESQRRKVAVALDVPGEATRSFDGDVSLEGASFVTQTEIDRDSVNLTFRVPTFDKPIYAQACVVGRRTLAGTTRVVVAFTNIDDDARLALAQWFDEAA